MNSLCLMFPKRERGRERKGGTEKGRGVGGARGRGERGRVVEGAGGEG